MSVPVGIYRIQFGLAFSAESDLPVPEPLYLTNHGEGKQLTLEPRTIGFNQDWSIQLPLEGETFDKNSEYRIIVPVHTSNFAAVSQDVVKSPDEVFLVKNLQVWSFEAVREADKLYEIRSNLYAGLIGSIPLLGADKEFKKAVIQHIPVVQHPPPKPVWRLIGPVGK